MFNLSHLLSCVPWFWLEWFNQSLQPCLSVWLKNPLLSCFLSPVHTASFWSKDFFFLQQIWWSKPLGCRTAECVFHYFNLSHDSVLVFHNCKGVLWRGSSTSAVTKLILLKSTEFYWKLPLFANASRPIKLMHFSCKCCSFLIYIAY